LRIYELALADYSPKECTLEYLPLGISEPRPNRHRGLTQVNKLLRAEFLPLYREAVRVTIRPRHLASYLNTFPLKDRAYSEAIRSALASPAPSSLPSLGALPFLSVFWVPEGPGAVFDPHDCIRQAVKEDATAFLARLAQSQKLWKDVLEDKIAIGDTIPDCTTPSSLAIIILDERRVQDDNVVEAKARMNLWFDRVCDQAGVTGLVMDCAIYGVAVSHETVKIKYTPYPAAR
jgi:hypothetical protein